MPNPPIIITIRYCTRCKWLLRAAWMMQEILQTFNTSINSVTLIPDVNGIYQIFINETKIWDKKLNGGFPEASFVKMKLRDLYLPGYQLKCIDNKINKEL